MAPARDADLGPVPGGIGLAAPDAQAQAGGHRHHVFDPECHQFGASQRRREADEQQGAVAPAACRYVAGGDEPAQGGKGQGGRLADGPAVLAQQPLQRPLNVAVRPVPGQVVEAVHLTDGGQAAAQRGGRVYFSKACEISADGCGLGRHGHEAGARAPGGVVGPVGLVGAQGGGRRRLSGKCLGYGDRRHAGRHGLGDSGNNGLDGDNG